MQKGLEACGVGLSELFFQKLQWLNDGQPDKFDGSCGQILIFEVWARFFLGKFVVTSRCFHKFFEEACNMHGSYLIEKQRIKIWPGISFYAFDFVQAVLFCGCFSGRIFFPI